MHTQPAENIDTVLGRFQAWAGSQTAVDAKAGIRELTDEEALQTGRYRWKGAGKAKEMPVAQVKQESAKGSAVKRTPGKQQRAKNRKTESARARKPAVATKSMPVIAEVNRRAFRDVLAETVRPREVLVAQPAELARQVGISVRLAPAERTLIRTRAAEAGVTVSAYVRQCALEVEQLREQVTQALAAMEKQASVQIRIAEVEQTRRPGIFARMARRLFPRSTPSLALRA